MPAVSSLSLGRDLLRKRAALKMNELDPVSLLVIDRDEPKGASALFPVAHGGDCAIAGQDPDRAVDPNPFVSSIELKPIV